MSPAPIKMFISHSKRDKEKKGEEIAKSIRDYINSEAQLKSFFDANDITPGFKFPKEIEAHIEQSVLLAIHTDTYSDREWCRKEIIKAKEKGCPIIVLDALDDGEQRSFPYMANVPILKLKDWDVNSSTFKNKEEIVIIITKTLHETLRLKYQNDLIHYAAYLFKVNLSLTSVISNPPELFHLQYFLKEHKSLIVYPDPPLGADELEFLSNYCKEIKTNLSFITTTFLSLIN